MAAPQTSYRLSYAGQPILVPAPQLVDVMDRWLQREYPAPYNTAGWDFGPITHLPLPPRPKPRPARLNVLEWPVGAARWGMFHCLVGQAALEAIRTSVGANAPVARDLLIETSTDGTTWTAHLTASMHLIDARPVFVSTESLAVTRSLYALYLADPRYYWWYRNSPVEVAVGTSWSAFLTSLCTAAGTPTPTIPSISTSYYRPDPERWTVIGPLPLIIDAAARQCGLRAVYTVSGSFGFVTAASALTSDSTRWTANLASVAAGGYRYPDDATTNNIAGNVPANYAVRFPTPGTNTGTVVTGTLASLALAEYTGVTGVANAQAAIYADQPSDVASPAPSTAAAQYATDWFRWAISPSDVVWRGLIAPSADNPSGCEDRVEWEYLPPDGTRRRVYDRIAPADSPAGLRLAEDRVVTRVVPLDLSDRSLYNGNPDTAQSDGGDCKACDWLYEIPTTACLLLKQRGGNGRCECAPEDPTYDDSGVVLTYSASLTASLATPTWVGAVGYTADGEVTTGAMGETCCGAGLIYFQPIDDLTAALSFQGVHVSCEGSSGSGAGAVFSIILTQICCGVDPDTGRKYVQYYGKGADACSGDVGPCGNTFHVRVECLVSCPERTCAVCDACEELPSPVAWYFGVTGSSTTTRDGNWVVSRLLTDACGPWTGTYGGITYTLTVTDQDPLAPLWVLTNGEATYEVASIGCDSAQTLFKTSGTGPASVVIQPITFAGEGEQECCCETLLTGLRMTMSTAVCDVTITDYLMDAEGVGNCGRQATGGGGLPPPARNSDKGYGARVTCNPDGTFNVYPVGNYSGPPETLNILNQATSPDILFSVTYNCTDADCDDCSGSPSITLTFTNI